MSANKRIHIVGCSPRSGTTLITELVVNCFEIDGFTEHELTIFKKPDKISNIFCSKYVHDILAIRPLLYIDPNLWVIFMMRDPRDVVVSRHGRDNTMYWTNLRIWKNYSYAAKRLFNHPRFLCISYEDLVTNPDKCQEYIMNKIPFLIKRADFSNFERIVRPSQKSSRALGGVRPISSKSVGNWRQNKPRLLAQLNIHGSITRDLLEFGYEKDDSWLQELEGIVPENLTSKWPEHLSLLEHYKQKKKSFKQTLRYFFNTWADRVPKKSSHNSDTA